MEGDLMGKSLEAEILPVVSSLKTNDWVCLECCKRTEPPCEGVYIAGGRVTGQMYPDSYYNLRGIQVLILLDPILDGKPFIVLLEDIISIKIVRPSVADD